MMTMVKRESRMVDLLEEEDSGVFSICLLEEEVVNQVVQEKVNPNWFSSKLLWKRYIMEP